MQRAKALGDYLIVALSTDEFNTIKGKKSYFTYSERKRMLEAFRCVDLVNYYKDGNNCKRALEIAGIKMNK